MQQKLKKKSLFICHWNLNSLTVHYILKLTQLKAYIRLDFICISKAYHDAKTATSLLEIQ